MANQLSFEDARRVLDAALEKAVEIGQPMNVAVVDDGGHLLAFGRQDGAILGSIDIATNKARTSAIMKMSTQELGKAAATDGPLYGIEVTNGGLVIFGGGIVLIDGDNGVVGAIGVSAGSVEQDVEVAQAGVDALSRRTGEPR